MTDRSASPSPSRRAAVYLRTGRLAEMIESDLEPLQAYAAERSYQIEFWPIGNRFKRGDRIRLVVLGASAASMPSVAALNTVRLGGPYASRLLLPVLPLP